MHLFIMTVIDEKEGTQLQVWRNNSDQVFLQMGEENDPIRTEFMTIDAEDARALARELERLACEIETDRYYQKLDQDNVSNRNISNLSDGKVSEDSDRPKPRKQSTPVKKSGEIHAQYTKDANGQMQLIPKAG